MKKTFKIIQIVFLLVLTCAMLLVHVCINMPGETLSSALPPLTSSQQALATRLRQHVMHLADDIGERNDGNLATYHKAADYIAGAFQEAGLSPYAEEYGAKSQFRNIIAEHYGTSLPDEVIIVGAHYDTVLLSPGADDNASGVAVMVEMARQLKTMRLARTIRFVAFANEEYPHYLRDTMGSMVHAKRAYERGDEILAMLSLEMLGYYSDVPNSQSYPAPLSWFYPDTGNFVAFVSNINSRSLVHESIRLFRESKSFPSEGLTAPVALIPDIRRSDHAAFWRYNYPALMVTDTANYRNRAYHDTDDISNSLNYAAMSRITTGLIAVLEQLAGME